MVRSRKGQEEEGQSSRGQASKRGRKGAAAPRRDPSTLPYSYFWNNEGHTRFYEEQVLNQVGKNGERIRITAGNERPLCPAHALKIDFLTKHHFDNVARMLQFQGWEFFLGIAIPFEPSMIKQFFHNLTSRNNENESIHFISKVNGHNINISSRILASFFAHEDEIVGAQVDGTNFSQYCEGFDITQARISLLDPSCRDMSSTLISDFSIENRLLFHILTKVIVPRSGSFTKATDWDIGLMYFIRNHIKISLGDLMLTHMLGIAHVKHRACAYLMPMTHFLITQCNIPPTPNDAISSKQLWYDVKMLRKLFVLDENTGIWGRKFQSRNFEAQPENAPQEHVHEDIDIDNDPPSFYPNLDSQYNPNPSQDFPSSSSFPPSQASYDPFHSQYNPVTYQSDMFTMMQQMNTRNVAFEESTRNSFEQMNTRNIAFEESTRMSFAQMNERLNVQDHNINEINDTLAKIFKDTQYF